MKHMTIVAPTTLFAAMIGLGTAAYALPIGFTLAFDQSGSLYAEGI